MPMKRRLPNKPNHHHKSRNHQQNPNQKGKPEQAHRAAGAAIANQAAHNPSGESARSYTVQTRKLATRLQESGSDSESSSTASDEGQALLTSPDYHRTRPIGTGAPSRIGTRRTSRASDSPSLGARLFVSPYNPQNLPALLLAVLASIYAHALVFGDMAIAMGLGKLWGRSQQGVEGGDGAMGMDMLNEGAEQMVGREVGGQEKKVKRRKKGSGDKPSHYPGMVNLSGTLCYMNSVLQALASVSSLINHLDRIYALAEQVDEPSMVSDALADVLRILNTAHARPPNAIRPNDLLVALYELPAIRRLLSTREQQDAHELFMVLAEAIGNESVRVARVVARSKGLGEVVSLQGYAAATGAKGSPSVGSSTGEGQVKRWKGRSRDEKVRGLAQPWEGLMARKRTCQVCGWSEGVRMDSLGGMELSLPQYGDVSLESCISQYLAPEHLTDVTCEMCSLKRTHLHYSAEVERLTQPPSKTSTSSRSAGSSHTTSHSGSFAALNGLSTAADPFDDSSPLSGEITPARKKRAKEAKKVEQRLESMIESGTVAHFGESLLPGPPDSVPLPIKWQTSRTPSVREGLVTRPPQVLRLHLIRSEYTPYGQLLKKTARVAFPVFLDMTPLVSRGIWDQRGGVLGALQSGQPVAQVPDQKKVIYRLSSVILHYGYTHSSGHYVCIRRKPVPASLPSANGELSASNGQLHTSVPAASTNVHVDTSAANGDTRADVPSTGSKACPDGCRCEDCVYFGQARELDAAPGQGWLRISDADVEEVGVEALVEARAQVSMLFYELVREYEGPATRAAGAAVPAEVA